MLSPSTEVQYASPRKEEYSTIKLEPAPLSRHISENSSRVSDENGGAEFEPRKKSVPAAPSQWLT